MIVRQHDGIQMIVRLGFKRQKQRPVWTHFWSLTFSTHFNDAGSNELAHRVFHRILGNAFTTG